MASFETLTKYIPELKSGDFGDWVIDKENDGTLEHPIHFPFVGYSQLVHQFQDDLFDFCEKHPEYEHTKYGEILDLHKELRLSLKPESRRM